MEEGKSGEIGWFRRGNDIIPQICISTIMLSEISEIRKISGQRSHLVSELADWRSGERLRCEPLGYEKKGSSRTRTLLYSSIWQPRICDFLNAAQDEICSAKIQFTILSNIIPLNPSFENPCCRV